MIRKQVLERLYHFYNHRRWVHPDPLVFLYDYDDPEEREIVGLLGACLAYGRVTQICKSVALVLGKMEPSPRAFLLNTGEKEMARLFSGFKHRFTTEEELTALLRGIGSLLQACGTLQNAFLKGYDSAQETVLPALDRFASLLLEASGLARSSLLPRPSRGSACKRLHLYLRWMVRRDGVDPGGWGFVDPAKLIVPLDTHMHRICGSLGFTSRRCADGKTALEVTRAFRKFAPGDPVRYDFALTRLGIRQDRMAREIFDFGTCIPDSGREEGS